MMSREQTVRLWFDMWIQKQDLGIAEIFSDDATYIESWGPQYCGVEKIQLWFSEWNQRGTVEHWKIEQFFHKDDQSVVEWHFRSRMIDGTVDSFDGVSLIRWNSSNQICFLQEFGCNQNRYDPYQDGPLPRFRGKSAGWF